MLGEPEVVPTQDGLRKEPGAAINALGRLKQKISSLRPFCPAEEEEDAVVSDWCKTVLEIGPCTRPVIGPYEGPVVSGTGRSCVVSGAKIFFQN